MKIILMRVLQYYPALITLATSPWWHITTISNEPFNKSIKTYWLFGKKSFEQSNKITFTPSHNPDRLWDTATVIYSKKDHYETYSWKEESLAKMYQSHKRDYKIEEKIAQAILQRIELIINPY